MKRSNDFINSIIKRMSLDQKVGALLTLGFAGIVPKQHIYDYITKYHCGGLRLSPEMRIFGKYVDPDSDKTVINVSNKSGYKYENVPPVCTAKEYKEILDELQMIAQKRPLSLPLHFSFDQEGGTSSDMAFPGINIFSKPMGIKATGDKKLSYLVSKAVAEQSKAIGFNWIHSPVLDVNTVPDNPEIVTRSYSDDANEVAEYALEACKGYKDGKVIATGKHFPGRGASAVDAHFQVPVIDVDKETLMNRELLPYRKLFEAGVLPSVMIAHSVFPAIDPDNIATVSNKILTGLLREELKFEGVIATDSMTMGGVATRYGVANACAMSLEAGADLVLMKAENQLVHETIDMIKKFINEGRISEEELDNKVYRILDLKHQYGLFYNENDKMESPEAVMNRTSIKKLSKHVAKKSVLVAKDVKNYLPLKKNETAIVIEQKIKNNNDMQWHSGILYENCLRFGADVDYLETDYIYDNTDKENIKAALPDYSTVIITNYYLRTMKSNKVFLEDILKDYKGKVIVVTNTPYEEISIPAEAECVIVTFATSPDNVEVTAGALYGEIVPEGVWPITYRLP